jgi:hypothetical protein
VIKLDKPTGSDNWFLDVRLALAGISLLQGQIRCKAFSEPLLSILFRVSWTRGEPPFRLSGISRRGPLPEGKKRREESARRPSPLGPIQACTLKPPGAHDRGRSEDTGEARKNLQASIALSAHPGSDGLPERAIHPAAGKGVESSVSAKGFLPG